MKILQILPYSASTVGGPARYVQSLSEALNEAGFDTAIEDRRPSLRTYLSLRRFRPDVIHVHNSFNRLAAAEAWRSVHGGKLVFSLHTQPTTRSYLGGDGPRPDYTAWSKPLARALLRRVDAITTVSTSIVETLNSAYDLRIDRYTRVPSGVGPSRRDDDEAVRIRGRLNLRPGTVLLVSLGVLAWDWKVAGHLLSLRALRILLDRKYPVCLAIGGDGPLRYVLDAEIKQLGLEGSVHLLGNISSPDVLLSACDIYLHMGLNEGAPLAVAEAAGAGKPIVAAAYAGLLEMLTHRESALLVKSDPVALADAIVELIDDPDLSRSLASAAKGKAEREWSWRVIASAYERLYAD